MVWKPASKVTVRLSWLSYFAFFLTNIWNVCIFIRRAWCHVRSQVRGQCSEKVRVSCPNTATWEWCVSVHLPAEVPTNNAGSLRGDNGNMKHLGFADLTPQTFSLQTQLVCISFTCWCFVLWYTFGVLQYFVLDFVMYTILSSVWLWSCCPVFILLK